MSWCQVGAQLPIGFINAGLGIWAIGICAALLASRKLSHKVFSRVLLIGCVAFALGCIAGWPATFEWQAPPPIYLCFVPFALHMDALSMVFIMLLAISGSAVALFSPGYLKRADHHINAGVYWSALFLFVLSMLTVVLSANAFTFLLCWELMSLSSVALVATDHTRLKARHAAMIYLGATRVATAFILGSFLWLHMIFDSWNFIDWKLGSPATLVPAVLLFIGLAVKAGIFPFHLWLPYAHTEAPATISALMSGVMVKVALYAMIRILIFGGADFQILGYIALFLGTISSAWGVIFALAQSDMKKMLAYHTVENVGLVLIGIAIAMLCRSGSQTLQYIAGIALSGALFHCVNHGCYKSLLFLGAGAVDSRAHTRNMGLLGGLAKQMPWTMTCFAIGCVAISCLPPLNGFASKWLLYQSLFRLAGPNSGVYVVERVLAMVFVGVLALVSGLALACFTKAVGISFLGKPRSAQAATAAEATPGMIGGQVLLVVACVLLGLFVPQVLQLLNHVVQAGISEQIDISAVFPVHMKSIVFTTACISGVVILLLMRGKEFGIRKYVTWDCGYGMLSARAEETSKSFSQPIARIFGLLFHYRMDTEIVGKDRRHFPERIKVHISMSSLLEEKVYGPIITGLERLSKSLAGIQSGSIHLYLLYVFVTLLVLVAVGTRL